MLPTYYQNYIALSRYARWIEAKGRRETWDETVDRIKNYWISKFSFLEDDNDFQTAVDMMRNLEIMGSMRVAMTAGEALDRDNVAGYNCSYTAMESHGATLKVLTDEMRDAGFDSPVVIHAADPRAFDELMYILLCGTGVGFSVERQYISTLPVIGHKLPRGIYARNEGNFPGVDPEELSTFSRKTNTIYVADSKYGWASALRILLVELYNGNFEVQWDTSKVRPAGERLMTFGGRSSGPDPLIALFNFCVGIFKKAEGRKLTSIEVHDIVCKIADIVVVGGVRRSALISLSNLTDDRMRNAKSGAWYYDEPQRALANNSVAYTEKPDVGAFMKEWTALYESKSGERGIYNRQASVGLLPERRKKFGYTDFGTNPCSEIVLRSGQFCNLTEVVARSEDTIESLKDKIKATTLLGTLQATLTNFVYLNPQWRKNTEEEALLGVSITGIMDHPILSGSAKGILDSSQEIKRALEILPNLLEELKEVAVETNKRWSKRLGINQSAAITCVKPSGTVSQLVDSASGIHARHSNFYIRTVRTDKKDPMYPFLKDQGIPVEDAIGKEDSTAVFSFPIKAPDGCTTRNDITAIDQLELWKTYALHWCEHKPSVTITVKEHEWMEAQAWVYENFDILSGVSFLPHSDHVYPQAPYQECTKEEYEEMLSRMPENIDWTLLSQYELEDTTTGTQELACTSGSCEIV